MRASKADIVSVTEQQPAIGTPRPKPSRRLGLSGKLLLLTIPLVMIAEILIYVPAIANYRINRLNDRLAAANTAALVLDAAPSDMVPDSLARQILGSIGARAVAIKMGQQRRLLASADLPASIDHDIDMRTMTAWSAIVDSIETMLETGNQTIRVVGPAPGGAQFIETVIDEAPLRAAMYRFSRNLFWFSLGISVLTAALVYLALHYMFVRPMRRLTESLVGFHENPESSARIIVPSQRGDEIGAAGRTWPGGLEDQPRPAQPVGVFAIAVGPARQRARSPGAALCAETDALAGARHRVLPVDLVLWPGPGSR